MSENSTLTELSQGIVALYYPSLVGNYIQLSALVLVLYDYLLTFPLELSLIWNSKTLLMKALFFVNRYAGVLYQISFVFLYFFKPALNTECNVFYYIVEVSNLLANAGIYCIFTLRTFAIYRKNWLVFLILAIPALFDVAADILATAVQTAYAIPQQLQVGPNTCDYQVNNPFSQYASALIGAISATVFDTLVIVLTVRRIARNAKSSITCLSSLLQAFLFILSSITSAIFLPIFGTLALNAIVLKDGSVNLSYVSDDVTAMYLAVRNVVVNRLVLSLSHAASRKDDLEYHTRTGLEPPVFAAHSVLGNIGGLVRSGSDDIDEEKPEISGSERESDIDARVILDFGGNLTRIDKVRG